LFLSGILIITILAGCAKDAGSEKDTVLPIILLSSPLNGQNFTTGQAIPISGNISDKQSITEVNIHVTNNNTGAFLMDVHLYPGSSTTNFNQSNIAIAGINYKIQVLAKDRALNEARHTVEVSSN